MRILENYGVFFEEINALAVADLHLGYEEVLRSQGTDIPGSQYKTMERSIGKMLSETKASKLIICGDIKHDFSKALQQEWSEVIQLIEFVRSKKVSPILIKGNHDKYISKILREQDLKLRNYFLEDGFLFLHGHETLEEAKAPKKYSSLVIAHEHPAIAIRDEMNIPHKYKAVLKGLYKKKPLVVLPAISPLAAGTTINSEERSYDLLSPILEECDISNFIPFLIDEEAGVREFPKIKYLF